VPALSSVIGRSGLVIEIGGLPIRLCGDDPSFLNQLKLHYDSFVTSARPRFEFEIDLAPPGRISPEEDVRVRWAGGRWSLERGDFYADWDPVSGSGRIRQAPNPYSIDTVLRIVHTLLLAKEGGFLLHASSGIRNGRAFLFSGVSGAGKTTMAKLAPSDVTLLTDEVSYITCQAESYSASGTPFAGELQKVGANLKAPVAALFLLEKGNENKIEPMEGPEAPRALLRNILFFAEDPAMVKLVFESACNFVSRVPVCRLTFTPDARVWELIV
jgi:hypothetical protein